MTQQEIKFRAAYLASEMRPSGKQNIEEWEEKQFKELKLSEIYFQLYKNDKLVQCITSSNQ